MREFVRLYFDEGSIVNHHIESFNDFIPSDNKNSRMQRVLDDLRITPDSERGYIELDPTKTKGKIVKIRFGRKRGEDGDILPDAEGTIELKEPKSTEASGSEERLTPIQARIRGLDYNADIHVKFTIIENEVEIRTVDENVGSIPMMVKSNGCNISRRAMQGENGVISDEEYEKRLIGMKEDPKDPGGYFIVGGAEKVLITLEDLAPNRIMVERDERNEIAVEVAKIFSQREGYRALTRVEKKKDGMITVSVPAAGSEIPLVALMKALGMESDASIYEAIWSCDEMENIINANLEAAAPKKDKKKTKDTVTREEDKARNSGYRTTEEAITYLQKNFASGQAKEYREKKINNILDRSLLPHIGNEPKDRETKAIFLGRMARAVLELSLSKKNEDDDAHEKGRKEDDKDHYANKRLKLSGDLMEDLFRASFANFLVDLKYQLEKNWSKKRNDVNIESAIRKDVLKNKLVHAVATGNWTAGRSGVSQLLDRTSFISATSHLRRVTSTLARSQPHFEARDLHPTQWGRLCPSETPEGQNCGLVKNAALIINVSKKVEKDDVARELENLGVVFKKSWTSLEKKKTHVFLNGDLIGYHDKPKSLVYEFRVRRRSSIISQEVNIRFDEEMGEVIVNCDEGRLRRPLFVLKDGRTILSRRELEAVREGNMSWNKLFEQGILEWLDADEEEDALIAVEPYKLPPRCPECNKALLVQNVDWLNPGKPEDAVLKCKLCGKEFIVPSEIKGTQYTHMELDPVIILGVAAGLVPYPEHNSSPRVTLGSAMAKQALGVPAANYRIRPDTRSHLLHYPQKPMVQTETMELVDYNSRPAGQNFCIAVMSYDGYNIEDALVMNKSSVQRGLGRSTFMRTYTTEEERYGGIGGMDASSYINKDEFGIPQPIGVIGVRDESAYFKLDSDGIINPEEKVGGGDVLIGKTSPPRYATDESENVLITEQKRREASLTVRPSESGFVDSVILTESQEGFRMVSVKVRSNRIPELGDKFCSRYGQKGVIGRLVDQCDMPFTADGITPDLVVNPHGIPSRMTIAHVLEMIGGKVGAMEGRTIDGTAFSGEREDSIRDELVKNGFKRTGKEVMYDGRTGKQISVDIYTGVIFYEKLHHMVSGKMHMRSRGPMQILTRQPTEGRSRLGGLRFGEMERDCLIGHGVAMVIKDRLLDQSDGRKLYVCGNKNCGHIAIMKKQANVTTLYCPVCGNNTEINPVETSYAFKLLMDELLSMGVAMRLQMEKLR